MSSTKFINKKDIGDSLKDGTIITGLASFRLHDIKGPANKAFNHLFGSYCHIETWWVNLC